MNNLKNINLKFAEKSDFLPKSNFSSDLPIWYILLLRLLVWKIYQYLTVGFPCPGTNHLKFLRFEDKHIIQPNYLYAMTCTRKSNVLAIYIYNNMERHAKTKIIFDHEIYINTDEQLEVFILLIYLW